MLQHVLYQITDFKNLGGAILQQLWHTFLGTSRGAYRSKGVVFLFCHLWFIFGAKASCWIDVGGNEHSMPTKKSWQELRDFFGKGEGPKITSGFRVSWVLVLFGPWSPERGRGDPAGNWSRAALAE